MSSTKPTLIYILSNGRSGSTILDILLGGSQEGFTTGELQLLPYELREGQLPCGCGEKVRDCKLWKHVLQKEAKPWLNKKPKIDFFRNSQGLGKVIRWSFIPSILFGSTNEKIQQLALAYGDSNRKLFNDIEEYAKNEKPEVQFFVDASKDIYRLLFLTLSNQFDLKVIHLTKAPQGFVYSMTKNNSSLPRIFRMSMRWLIENYLMIRLGKNHFSSDSFVHLKYEDFATSPQQKIQQIANQLNINLTKVDTKKFRTTKIHGISGNISRYDNKPFQPDFKWKEKMNKRSKIFIQFITFFTARLLKY